MILGRNLKVIIDGKVYIPMAASRDYQTDTSTITFIECPEEGK